LSYLNHLHTNIVNNLDLHNKKIVKVLLKFTFDNLLEKN